MKTIEIPVLEYIEDGSGDQAGLQNFVNKVGEAINEHVKEVNALAEKSTQTVSFAIEAMGITEIISDKHVRAKITNVFFQLGDNLDMKQSVKIVGHTETISFSKTEKAAKTKIAEILNESFGFAERMEVETSTDRRIIVNVTYESME